MCSGTSGSTVNWCIGSILPSAATLLLPLLFARAGPGLGKPHDVPHPDAEPEEQHQQEEQRESPVAGKRGQTVQTPSDHGPAHRGADQMPEELLPEPIARVRLRSCGPLRFRLLKAPEPLIERFEPCVWWKLRNLVGFVLCHASPLCVAPRGIQGASARRRTWRKATPP